MSSALPAVPVLDGTWETAPEVVGRFSRDFGNLITWMPQAGMTQEEWRRHFGRQFDRFARAKKRCDPDNVLTPGQGFFCKEGSHE